MTETQKLLAEYARDGSETAFRELVTRYVDLVYSCAVRLLAGHTHHAQDVTQTVFADLARKAGKLSGEVMLGGWLHRHTCFVAANVMRGERRRQQRERTAAEMNANDDHSEANLSEIRPVLDDAINQLGPEDRTAILLRFFEKHDLRSVGEALGASENAAQKRVSRALDELRGLLKRRGVALSAAGLGTLLTTEAVSAAPVGLAAGLATTALADAGMGGGTAWSLLKLMSTTKMQVGLISAVVAGSVATSLIIQHSAEWKAREVDATLRQQAMEIAGLQEERARLAARPNLAGMNNLDELLRLRNEAELLRERSKEVQTLSQENKTLRTAFAKAPGGAKTALQLREEGVEAMVYGKQLGLYLIQYALDNHNAFPTNFDQLSNSLAAELRADAKLMSDQFEIVYRGPLYDAGTKVDPSRTPILREKQSRQLPTGQWQKAYVFLDGSGKIQTVADGDFDAWERQQRTSATNR